MKSTDTSRWNKHIHVYLDVFFPQHSVWKQNFPKYQNWSFRFFFLFWKTINEVHPPNESVFIITQHWTAVWRCWCQRSLGWWLIGSVWVLTDRQLWMTWHNSIEPFYSYYYFIRAISNEKSMCCCEHNRCKAWSTIQHDLKCFIDFVR